MEVYEVMFIAVPLWFCLVGFLFSLVFGMDVVGYFKAKRTPLAVGVRHAAHPVDVEEIDHYYRDAALSDERELVHH